MRQEAGAETCLQAFYKRFSGLIRALPPEPAGADAWRATTYGHGVLQTNPLGSALDQESSTSILRRATKLIQTPAPTVHAAPASYSGDLDRAKDDHEDPTTSHSPHRRERGALCVSDGPASSQYGSHD